MTDIEVWLISNQLAIIGPCVMQFREKSRFIISNQPQPACSSNFEITRPYYFLTVHHLVELSLLNTRKRHYLKCKKNILLNLFQYTITFIEIYSVVHFSFKNRSLLELKLPVVTPFYSITMETKFWPRYCNFRFQMQLNNRHYTVTENKLIVMFIDLIWSLVLNRPFCSCLLSDLAFGWQRG